MEMLKILQLRNQVCEKCGDPTEEGGVCSSCGPDPDDAELGGEELKEEEVDDSSLLE